jgi:hypothetical protein
VLIDCDSCAVRDLQCGDCVVSVLLGGPPGEVENPGAGLVEVDDGARHALAVLADSGLVPHLRLVPTAPPAAVLDAAAEQERSRRRGVS